MGKLIRWRRWRVRFRRALAPLRPVTDLLAGSDEGRRRRGFSLIEVAIAVAASAMLVSALYSSLRSGSDSDHALRVRVDLQLDAARVLKEITTLLKTSEAGGESPMIWSDGARTPESFANPAAVSAAMTAEEGHGPSQEIAFRSGAGLFALVLVPGPAGNELHLRRHDAAGAIASSRVIGRNLERITFEKAGDSIRVVAWFRRVVDKKVYTVRQTSTVNMRSLGD